MFSLYLSLLRHFQINCETFTFFVNIRELQTIVYVIWLPNYHVFFTYFHSFLTESLHVFFVAFSSWFVCLVKIKLSKCELKCQTGLGERFFSYFQIKNLHGLRLSLDKSWMTLKLWEGVSLSRTCRHVNLSNLLLFFSSSPNFNMYKVPIFSLQRINLMTSFKS